MDRPGGRRRLHPRRSPGPGGRRAGRPVRPSALADRHHPGRGVLRRLPGRHGGHRARAAGVGGADRLRRRSRRGHRLPQLPGHAARPGPHRRPPGRGVPVLRPVQPGSGHRAGGGRTGAAPPRLHADLRHQRRLVPGRGGGPLPGPAADAGAVPRSGADPRPAGRGGQDGLGRAGVPERHPADRHGGPPGVTVHRPGAGDVLRPRPRVGGYGHPGDRPGGRGGARLAGPPRTRRTVRAGTDGAAGPGGPAPGPGGLRAGAHPLGVGGRLPAGGGGLHLGAGRAEQRGPAPGAGGVPGPGVGPLHDGPGRLLPDRGGGPGGDRRCHRHPGGDRGRCGRPPGGAGAAPGRPARPDGRPGRPARSTTRNPPDRSRPAPPSPPRLRSRRWSP